MDDTLERAELAEEDRARADCYALISRLFCAAPDAGLIQGLASDGETAPEAGGSGMPVEGIDGDELAAGGFTEAYAAFRDACRSADPQALRQEYDDLFVGAGKALVTPYTSGYAVPHAPDRHLVALREHLAAWGLARRDAVFEVEDHVSAVCDVMRWLIEHRPLSVQRTFFDEFVYTGIGNFCDAIDASASPFFYRAAAALTRSFLSVESEAFSVHMGE